MNNHEFDFLVFIGRMRPFHRGHKKVIDAALKKSRYVFVLVGSAFKEPNSKNPWTYEEVREMIDLSYHNPRIIVLPLEDEQDNDQWVRKVENIVYGLTQSLQPNSEGGYKIGLIGHTKDDSSFYLKLFPMWDRVEIDNTSGINATDIRKAFFLKEEFIPFYLELGIENYLVIWKLSNIQLYNQIKNEFKKSNS